MSDGELGSVALALVLLLLGSIGFGHLFRRFRQPKVVGEIVAGIVLGPTLFGHLAPEAAEAIFGSGGGDPTSTVLAFMYHLGLLLLMFVSGFSVRHVLSRENRAPTAWILGLGTPLPFLLALGASPWLPIDGFVGEAGSRGAVVLVFAIATAVTSIPVITKIFHDLGILHTRFASLILGAAVFEDIMLWGVLSIASALATATVAAGEGALAGTITTHVGVNLAYTLVGLFVAPTLLRRLARLPGNVIARRSPVSWVVAVLFGYVAVAAVLDVTMVFGAFLAGFGIVGGFAGDERQRYREALDSVEHVSTAVFIPIYFALVGLRIDLQSAFDPLVLVLFLVGTSTVVILSIGGSARLAGFRGLDLVNLGVTCNARGGPGIVLASVALDAGIINAPFFTTLVLTAVLTSQACGFWLDHVLRRGWPLLSGADLQRRGLSEPAMDDASVAPPSVAARAGTSLGPRPGAGPVG
ncbi:cation:proton antiporter [Salsipaludibacter albus]|uniref:cation:proton antiporter n=1 Tax=Salsipaludibacter albus TaxID=2849650 RepID=UPI001EE40C02|nr:cation:proton antiporter [Salsipaludibacter albus]